MHHGLRLGLEALASYLGTEAGLAAFEQVNFNTLLPAWARAAFMLSDVQEADGDAQPPLVLELPSLLQNALPIAGALHIFSNAAAQVSLAPIT